MLEVGRESRMRRMQKENETRGIKVGINRGDIGLGSRNTKKKYPVRVTYAYHHAMLLHRFLATLCASS